MGSLPFEVSCSQASLVSCSDLCPCDRECFVRVTPLSRRNAKGDHYTWMCGTLEERKALIEVRAKPIIYISLTGRTERVSKKELPQSKTKTH